MGVYVDIKKKPANYEPIGSDPALGNETFPKGTPSEPGSSITRKVKGSDMTWDKGTTGTAGVGANPSYESVHANRNQFRK